MFYSDAPLINTCSRFFFACLIAFIVCGCASTHYTMNSPYDGKLSDAGYRLPNLKAGLNNSDSLFLSISFSGGGLRAATLGYGVLESFKNIEIEWEGTKRSLLSEVDLITGVSGGSLIATYYALNREKTFKRFEQEVLAKDIQAEVVSRSLSPRGWWRLSSPRFGRSDILQEVLDETIFKGATFANLLKQQERPFLIVSASDMTQGGRFEFVQDQFDFFCSQLSTFPLARAVAASSAVPIVLSPITLHNHGSECGLPRLLAGSSKTNEFQSSRISELETLRTKNQRPFIHLVDGGLADNVTARGPLEYVEQYGNVIAGSRASGLRGVRRAVFVIVNAETSARDPLDSSGDVPGILRSALALADVPINRYSSESLVRLKQTVLRWQREVDSASASEKQGVFSDDMEFHLIEISLASEPDLVLREQLMSIPTALKIDLSDAKALRDFAHAAINRNEDMKRLLKSLTK